MNFSLVDKREFISNLEANRTGALILKMSIFHQARACTEVFHKWSRSIAISDEKR